jgi:porin
MKPLMTALSVMCGLGLTSVVHAQTVSGRSTEEGPLSGVGDQLDNMGIRLRSQLINEFAGNTTGGVKQGDRNVGQFQFGVSLDLSKMIGLQGGQLHTTFVQDYGKGLSHDITGTFTKSQEIYKNEFDHPRLGVFAYEQKLFDDRLDIIAGRLGTTTFYGRLVNDCYFQSGITCSVPQILNSSAGFTFPTSATWGANVTYRLAEDAYVEAGAFEVDPFIQQTNGLYWGTDHATGVTIPFEIGKGVFDVTKEAYPSSIKVGGYFSTSPLADINVNTKGQSLGRSGGTAQNSSQIRSGVYTMGEKAVWRPYEQSDQVLSLFGGFIKPIDDQEVMIAQVYGGATLRGPLPGRNHDILAFTANYYRLSDGEYDFLRDARIRAGGSGTNNANEFAFELDYSALIYRDIRLAPNLQYIVHPDNSSIPNTRVLPNNELVVGLKLTVNFSGLLGLPLAPNLSD